MTGRRVPYLVQRGSKYQVRLPVPKKLQTVLSMKELQRSIQTSDYELARRIALRAGSSFADLCVSVSQMTDTSTLNVPALIDRFFEALLASFEPHQPVAPADHGWTMNHQEYAAEDMVMKLNGMLAHHNYSQAIKKDAEALLATEGRSITNLSALELAQLHEGVARAKKEHINFVMFRQQSLLDPYIPSDPLFSKHSVQLVAHGSPGQHPAPVSGVHQSGHGGLLRDRIEQYLASAECRPNTIKEKRVVLNWFAEKVGPTTDVRMITADHMLEFKKALSELKVHTASSTKLADAASKAGGTPIHPKTAKKKLDTVKTFLNWLAAVGAIGSAPGTKIQIKIPKTPKSQQRRPFTPEELGMLFSSPMYSGCRTASARHVPGKLIIKDDRYWMPLVLLYTGMRLAEPLQVQAEDVHVDTDFPYFDIDLAKLDLKQDVSDRFVPIHPDLIDFGFADFVRKRQKEKAKPRLFRGITSNAHVANFYSKALGKYFDRVGLDDPRLVAHSFRHGFKDALRNAAVPEGEQKFIMGHSDSEAAHNYGTGSKIEVLWNWVAKLDLQIPANVKAHLTEN